MTNVFVSYWLLNKLHKFTGLKQNRHNFVDQKSHWTKSQDLSRTAFLLEALGEHLSLCLVQLWRSLHSLAYGPFLPLQRHQYNRPGSRAGKAGPGSRRKPFRGGAQVRSLKIQFRKVNTTGSSPGSQEKTTCAEVMNRNNHKWLCIPKTKKRLGVREGEGDLQGSD